MSLPFTPYKAKFKANNTIYQQQILCTVAENEFNYTLNPTAVVSGSYYYRDFVTGSEFQPYVTTVGLYNEANELLAVAKLAQPFRLSTNTDVTFVVKYDF